MKNTSEMNLHLFLSLQLVVGTSIHSCSHRNLWPATEKRLYIGWYGGLKNSRKARAINYPPCYFGQTTPDKRLDVLSSRDSFVRKDVRGLCPRKWNTRKRAISPHYESYPELWPLAVTHSSLEYFFFLFLWIVLFLSWLGSSSSIFCSFSFSAFEFINYHRLSNIRGFDIFPLNYGIYILFISFRTGNYSRRSENPFRSDIDWSLFDMVYALLVPGRVNISIS